MSALMPKTQESHLSYDAAMLFWRVVTQIFFREVRPRGAYHIPRDGPVIFVGAPHNNQFMDPLLLSLEVYRETHRHVQFLTAAKSMKRKFVGFFSRLMESIPVVRAADSASPGTGLIRVSPDDPLLILGDGTRFTSELSPKMQIMLPKSMGSQLAEVVEVISDVEVRVKREFGGEKGAAKVREKIAEAQAQGQNGLVFKKMPFVDQQEMYQYVYECLQHYNGSIGIFPEGGSHDRTDLLPLKAGVSVMALGAMANNPELRVKIIPVGLSYFHAHKFRSRAVVEFGQAIDVPSELVEMFKLGGDKKREAVQKFLDVVYDALKTVTVRAPDYDTLMLIQAARRLYKAPGQHLTLGQVVELNRRLVEGYTHFKDEPRVIQVRKDVLAYNRKLRDLGLRDHQVPIAKKANWKSLGLLLYRMGLLLAWTVLSLPGGILNAPIFIIASILSRKKAKEALAESTVKIAGRDVLATWKILISLGIAPLLYGFYAVIATVVAIRANFSWTGTLLTPVVTILSLPFMNFAALKFGEAGFDVLKSLPPLIVALLPGQQGQLSKLKETRSRLANEVVNVINEFGPKLYDDFDEKRLLPSSSVPPPKPNLARRQSGGGGAVNHPMTWLDERLFGWSRSSRRGTSAWLGDESTAVSHAVTPDDSGDEGDYEHVLGYLPTGGLTAAAKSRSRTNSYANIQKLRMAAPISTSPVSRSPERSPTRESPRMRRKTLTDNVPVEVLASQVENLKTETFATATENLNDYILVSEEIRQRKPRAEGDAV
ncbi:hypothetical protein CYLTODRAFT_424785 [Cylindrobasidium torrendii FP15055 ss-10]|uniref:Phospholipid/glycerol acyltransferase domain-containing protein n=1 Tax=Cylindrobasidium torrendii FP15055 ss-10 TaxID=1314674 RepID=A0A0D7B5Z2_9AGAR|nr:hypothetical protein CYLTODRAFT_424785 [Cylindrobasidium torrendii FP15055 ss-10]